MPEMPAPWQMRPMQQADLAAVAALEAQSQFTPWSEQVFRDCLSEGYLCRVVTDVAGAVVAFVIIYRVLDEAHVLNIAVAPDCQRRGIAAALLREMMDVLRPDTRCLFLEVRESNQAARALYQRLGFVGTGMRRNYYRTADGHENAVLMRCELPA